MSQTITVIYADGVLRPLTPLDLPEQTEIELEVMRVATPEEDERSLVLRALADAGVIINKPYEPLPPSPISDEERERLGRVFAVGKPLSEIIVEEREGRCWPIITLTPACWLSGMCLRLVQPG